MQGLRTLVLATKIIPEDDYLEWDSRYQEAAASFEDRDGKMNALGVEIEQNLELIGVTAIEDKLQVGRGGRVLGWVGCGLVLEVRTWIGWCVTEWL